VLWFVNSQSHMTFNAQFSAPQEMVDQGADFAAAALTR
jgi:hypothetical protein